MLKHCICCISVGLILLSSPQESKTQQTQANSRAKQQQANSKFSITSLNKPSTQIDDPANAASGSQNQERNAKDEAFKAEQLRQNRIIVWATVFIAIFGGLSFVAALIY